MLFTKAGKPLAATKIKSDKSALCGSVTTPKDFRAAGVSCGLKEKGPDLAVIFSDHPCHAAGVFTTNKFKAAPVLISRQKLRNGSARGLVLNSGNANACTGPQGAKDAAEMCNHFARLAQVPEEEIIVASTGIIGMPLPMHKIRAGIENAVKCLSVNGGEAAAQAIMTTDTKPKHLSCAFELEADEYHIGAMAKGSGMISPRLATMIGVFTTDIGIHPQLLHEALKQAADVSFNKLTIDGEMSTNDCVFIFANGAGGRHFISDQNDFYKIFAANLTQLSIEMTKLLAADGEGATKSLTVAVRGAQTLDEADKAARAVANSLLVKTAIYGQDANWGRIFSALGACEVSFDPEQVSVELANVLIAQNGQPVAFDKIVMKSALEKNYIPIEISIGSGLFSSTIYSCDLSHEYVTINAEYHT